MQWENEKAEMNWWNGMNHTNYKNWQNGVQARETRNKIKIIKKLKENSNVKVELHVELLIENEKTRSGRLENY